MFEYDWSRFDAKLGLIFMIGVLGVFNLAGRFEFSVYAAGISALLAWLTVLFVPGPRLRQHLLGLVVYLTVGAILTWLADLVWPHPWMRLIAMGAVTFVGYMMLLRGSHAFMVAWCLVYWYLLAPLFLSEQGLTSVALGHVVGVGLVIILNLLKPIWSPSGDDGESESSGLEGVERGRLPVGNVARYSSIVAIGIVAGVSAGTRWLTSDPTLIANATLNVISPTLRQTWRNGVERAILGTLGVVGGFYLGWFFPDPWVGHLVTAVFSFLTLAVAKVSFGVLIGVFFFFLAYPWGAMHSDAGHLIANEKILGELIGVAVAMGAMAILTRLQPGGERFNPSAGQAED